MQHAQRRYVALQGLRLASTWPPTSHRSLKLAGCCPGSLLTVPLPIRSTLPPGFQCSCTFDANQLGHQILRSLCAALSRSPSLLSPSMRPLLEPSPYSVLLPITRALSCNI